MNSKDWRTVKKILLDTIERPAAERADFLSRCGLTPELLREVESLLAGESEAEGVMGVSAVEFAGDLLPDTNHGVEGTRVGVYVIEREIGVGGMGAVYLARRDDGKFEQRVAIKMLRRELNAANLRRVFEREKNIQARLDHPGIARMLDAGTTEDGVPYFAMEYVDGLAIDDYCESRSLGHVERLKLFAKVCDAVSSSHQKLIVHRDLKPSNILVSADGQPKVLDFGISKLLDTADEGPSATLLGAMTPEYASPEQINGESVTTATDVYSLGVVLFKLLTGRHPFETECKTNGNLQKAISHGEPIAPSIAV